MPRLLSFTRIAFALALLTGLPVGAPESAAKPPPAAPKTFVLEYHWGFNTLPPAGSGPTATLTIFRDGTFFAVDDWSGDTGTGTWFTRRGGREIVFEIDGVDLIYVGTRTNTGEYRGSMAIPNGPQGVWRGAYVP